MKKTNLPDLPINEILAELKDKLSQNNSVILSAEPGSGKTTIVPLALIDESWLAGKKIIMLEPRRIAVRMAARRLSELANERVGSLVGYRIRFDKKVSAKTKIEVVTEGIFIRMIQNDPELTGIGLVIFDEFHLRSIQADLALALILDMLALRGDLKIVVMSATLESEKLGSLLNDPPMVEGKGRCYPVNVEYLQRQSTDYLIPRVVKAVKQEVGNNDGDILVFLPGAGEIRAVGRKLQGIIETLPLYGNLSQKEQDLVFCTGKKQRVILATSIAETSLTIPGVKTVIDSGLMKVPKFSSATGLTSLETVTISKGAAEQRAGRAGRLGPGFCYRLWTKGEQHSRAEYAVPEIIGADLAPLLLEILQWGVREPSELAWLDEPRDSGVAHARQVLKALGVIDENFSLTKLGGKISKIPLHPRLALMLLKGMEKNEGTLACYIAAIVQNREIFRGNGYSVGVDITDRLEVLQFYLRKDFAKLQAKGADLDLCRKVVQEARQYQKIIGVTGKLLGLNFEKAGNLLVWAYPDRIGMKKGGSQVVLASGRGAVLPVGDLLNKADFIVAANLDGGKRQGKVYMAARLAKEDFFAEHGHLLATTQKIYWQNNKVNCALITTIGSLEIASRPILKANTEDVLECLLAGIKVVGLQCLPWQKKSSDLQDRIEMARKYDPAKWPDFSDKGLLDNLAWLSPFIVGIKKISELKKLDLYEVLSSRLSWQDKQNLDKLLPKHIVVPSGSKVRIKYAQGEQPVLAVRLQELFGLEDTPTILAGKIRLTIHLLSPASRPIQVTDDMASFWQNTYQGVKKELKGRYNHWPDDPMTAKATNRIKRRKK